MRRGKKMRSRNERNGWVDGWVDWMSGDGWIRLAKHIHRMRMDRQTHRQIGTGCRRVHRFPPLHGDLRLNFDNKNIKLGQL